MFKRGGETSKGNPDNINKQEVTVESSDPSVEAVEGSEAVTDLPLAEKILALEAELQKSNERAEEYYSHLQRLQAEFDNYRKRTQKEKEDTVRYAAERIVESMLPVLDNLERAIASAQNSKDFQAYSQGVEMIAKQMLGTLAKEGLTPIEAVGQTFDPNLHDAVMQVESTDYPENTVVEQLQKGYYLKERVLRHCMVKVSC